MIRKAFEAESGEMNQAGLREPLARESVVDASRFVALAGSFESIGLLSSGRLVPEVTPPEVIDPFDELGPPLRVLGGVGVEVSDHEGAFACMLTRPRLKLREWLTFHALCWHVDGGDSHTRDAAAHPVVLEFIALSAEARVGLQLEFTIDPQVALAAMKGSA